MSKFSELAKVILQNVGGAENVDSVTHCMTRLRFSLKDVTKANVDALKSLKGVQGVVTKNGQFQVVIGTDVPTVYEEINKLGNFGASVTASTEDVGIISRLLGGITAIFQPVLPAICGSGMIRALLAVLTFCGVLSDTSQTYTMLYMFADAAFYFLPVTLAFSAARYFKCNPFIAAILGATLLHPTFSGLVSAGEPVSLFGFPVRLASYGNAVVPPLLIVWLQKYVELFAKKITPKQVKVFMEPLIIFIIVAPVSFVVLGPLGSYIGDGLAVVFRFLNEEARWVVPLLVGTFCPLLVMTGMHYSIFPIQLAQFATLGYGTILAPGMLCSNLGQAGATFAVAIRSKNQEMKEIAFSAGTTALFGIIEPALYGVTMKLRRPLIGAMIGGGLAGLWAGFSFLRSFTPATPGILALPVYIGEDLINVVNAVICIVIAFIASFIITFILGFEDEPDGNEQSSQKNERISEEVSESSKSIVKEDFENPLSGKLIPLSEVKDEVFSSGMMGKGYAVIPEEGKLYAPFDGTVNALFPTLHAVGLTREDGLELLVHIGMDTVNLNGKFFEAKVKQGDLVKRGDLLIQFDLQGIKNEGYDVTTPVILPGGENDVVIDNWGNVKHGQICARLI